jgi:3-oxoacyl-[acyl-carrier protein] reductase
VAKAAGLLSLARTVAAEYAADGIRMNVVAGGAISTGVANTLTEEWASYVTGQQIVVDGGVSVRGPFA